MRVSGEEYLRVSQLRAAAQGSVLSVLTTAPARREGGESVSAGDLRLVTEAASHLPDVREQIVSSLRERIEAGTYFVSGEEIAEMMIRRTLADRVR